MLKRIETHLHFTRVNRVTGMNDNDCDAGVAIRAVGQELWMTWRNQDKKAELFWNNTFWIRIWGITEC